MQAINIHPIFVHFPVAFLSTYAIFELFRFRKVTEQTYWFFVKAVLVIVGTAGSYAALLTGGLAEDTLRAQGVFTANPQTQNVIDVHSNWAAATAIIFSVLAAAYIIEWVNRTTNISVKFSSSALWVYILKFKTYIVYSWVTIVLALTGLIVVTITGSLGGAIAYGPTIDPVVNFVYNLVVR